MSTHNIMFLWRKLYQNYHQILLLNNSSDLISQKDILWMDAHWIYLALVILVRARLAAVSSD